MTTPVPRPEQRPTVPAVPQRRPTGPVAPPPHQGRDFGWLITLLGASGALLGSWTLFPSDGTDGMWAGYWTSLFGTLAILGAICLRTTLPSVPVAIATAATGLGLILTGALHGYAHIIEIPMVAGGAFVVLGAVLQADSRT